MKQFLLKSVAFLMATLVLFASVGFTVVEHECVLSGKLVYVEFSHNDSHCGHCHHSEQTKPVIVAKDNLKRLSCCKHSEKYCTIDAGQVLSKNETKITNYNTDFQSIAPFLYFRFFKNAIAFKPPKTSISSFFSLFYGRGMLIFIQSLLI